VRDKNVANEQKRFVRILQGVYCIGGDKPKWSCKIGNFSLLNIALNGFLMTQRQMTLKHECGHIMLVNFIGHVFHFLSWYRRCDWQ